ncbi:MAG: sigma-70 family RNA polymerase sigma factor [Gemmatimonadaceae bacterium]
MTEECDLTGDGAPLAARFEEHRGRLRAIARRILGSATDADDAVQEAWLRFNRADIAAIDHLDRWLTTVVSRVCLSMLEAQRSRPQPPVGAELSESHATAGASDPEREALLAESVGLALGVVIDTLSPPERVAFVLHDIFAYPFDQIAPILDRGVPATRKLASRARARVRAGNAAGPARRLAEAAVVDAFLAAARHGDFDALLAVLDPDVVLRADTYAAALGAPKETRGAEAVATFARRARGASRALLDGAPAVVWMPGGVPRVLYSFTTGGDRITAIDLIGDPARLGQIRLCRPMGPR